MYRYQEELYVQLYSESVLVTLVQLCSELEQVTLFHTLLTGYSYSVKLYVKLYLSISPSNFLSIQLFICLSIYQSMDDLYMVVESLGVGTVEATLVADVLDTLVNLHKQVIMNDRCGRGQVCESMNP